MAEPEIAVLVSTFERPHHLRRVLASIAVQRGVEGTFEVVVADDGSRDQTALIVREFAASVPFPVRFTTHPHDGFQLARCRNEGVRASAAPYLLFLDGDCMIPPDHLRVHLDRRRHGYAMAGYCVRLRCGLTQQITEDDARRGTFRDWVPWKQRLRIRRRHLQALFYALLRDPTRPKLFGGNVGIWRADYERVNGYDENFRGWGCEDDDLRLRLRAVGVRVASIAWWTHTYHLWHARNPTAPATWREGANVDYLQRPVRLTRCLMGLQKRPLEDLRIRLVGRPAPSEQIDRLLPLWCREAIAASAQSADHAEMEVAFAGGDGQFSKRSQCRVLVVPRGMLASPQLVRNANSIFAEHEVLGRSGDRTFAMDSLDALLQTQLGVSRLTPKPAFRDAA